MTIKIPEFAADIIDRLERAGYESYVVGGCVRDSIMGKTPHDWDICTAASPEKIKSAVFPLRILTAGEKHGTIAVLREKECIEVTSFRTEGVYSDMRRPDNVTFVKDLSEDLKRRDFTMNAMAYSPKRGFVDLFGGIDDVKNKVIRCVGDPERRFSEDALRIMRAVRFSSVLGFDIEGNTAKYVLRLADKINKIAAERVLEELKKTLCGDFFERIQSGYEKLFAAVLGEENISFEKLCRVHELDKSFVLRLSALLNDKKSAANVCRKLKIDNSSSKRIMLITDILSDCDIPQNRTEARKLISEYGFEAVLSALKIMRVYVKKENCDSIDRAVKTVIDIEKQGDCISLSSLKINGKDLIELGFTGQEIGKELKRLLNCVMEDKFQNERDMLLADVIHKNRKIDKI